MCPNRAPRAARRSFAWLAFSVMINVAMIHAESNAAFNLAHRREQTKNNGNLSIAEAKFTANMPEQCPRAISVKRLIQHGVLTSFDGVTIGASTDLTNNRDLVF